MLGDQYKYPEWSRYLSWALTLSSILCIPIYIIYKVLITPGGFKHVSFNIFFCQFKGLSQPNFVTQRMRVCFQPERQIPSAVPGQITGSAGTSVWHAQTQNSTISRPPTTMTNRTNTKHAPITRTNFAHGTPDHVVCPMEPSSDLPIGISENFDYDRDPLNGTRRFPLTLGGHFQHFRDSEELYEPGPFRTEWLVWLDFYGWLL